MFDVNEVNISNSARDHTNCGATKKVITSKHVMTEKKVTYISIFPNDTNTFRLYIFR
jgi:hypothetical protein